MSWYPKTRRIAAGHYAVECGELRVHLKRCRGAHKWIAIVAGRTNRGFDTKAEALEYAIEYLQEYA
jgi:hypothetical protein